MALSAVGLHTFGLVVGTRGSKQTSEVENLAPYESAAQLLAQVCEQTGDDPECCRLELKSSAGWTALDDTGRTLESFGITRAGLVLELVMQSMEETTRRREAAIAAAVRAALEAESAKRVRAAQMRVHEVVHDIKRGRAVLERGVGIAGPQSARPAFGPTTRVQRRPRC